MDANTILHTPTRNAAAIENGQQCQTAHRLAARVQRNTYRAIAMQCDQICGLLAALEVYANPDNWTLDENVWIWDGPGKHPADAALAVIEAYRITAAPAAAGPAESG
jgi:hypothetical protein